MQIKKLSMVEVSPSYVEKRKVGGVINKRLESRQNRK
jgi:hypothetical protein